jgi:uncharacterized membrane protein
LTETFGCVARFKGLKTPFMTSTFQNIARWLFCLPLFAFGIIHITHADILQNFVPSYMPLGGRFWCYASGTSLILAALGISLRKWDRTAALCLATTIYAFALLVHLPACLHGDPSGLSNLLKDFMIASACLVYASLAVHRK